MLLGIAIRTGSPLSLNLAEPVWKQLAGMPLNVSDLTEIDKDYVPGKFSSVPFKKSKETVVENVMNVAELFLCVCTPAHLFHSIPSHAHAHSHNHSVNTFVAMQV